MEVGQYLCLGSSIEFVTRPSQSEKIVKTVCSETANFQLISSFSYGISLNSESWSEFTKEFPGVQMLGKGNATRNKRVYESDQDFSAGVILVYV